MNRTDAICLLVVILVIVGVISALTYSWYTDITKESKTKEEVVYIIRKMSGVEAGGYWSHRRTSVGPDWGG